MTVMNMYITAVIHFIMYIYTNTAWWNKNANILLLPFLFAD